jgi:hypothetical protein
MDGRGRLILGGDGGMVGMVSLAFLFLSAFPCHFSHGEGDYPHHPHHPHRRGHGASPTWQCGTGTREALPVREIVVNRKRERRVNDEA